MVVMMSWKCAVCGYHLRSVLFRGTDAHANRQTGEWCAAPLQPVLSIKVKPSAEPEMDG